MSDRGVTGRVLDLVLGAGLGLVVGAVLSEPADRLWHRVNGDTYQVEDRAIEITATSTLASEEGCRYAICNYNPDNLTDSRLKSAWASDGSATGQLELQILLLEGDVTIDRLELWPGWQDGDQCRMRRNARPRDIQLLDGDDNEIGGVVTLADAASGISEDDTTVIRVGWTGRVLKIRILSVYPGEPCNRRAATSDVLISELLVHARY